MPLSASPIASLLVGLLMGLAGACSKPPVESPKPAAHTLALIKRAEEAESQRQYLRAQALYAQAKVTAPDDVSRAHAARTYARALIFYGERKRAIDELLEAAKLAPDDAGTWHDLGVVRHHLKDLAGAETAFRRSIAAAPDDGRSRVALAILLVKQKRYPEALAEYRALRAVRLPAPVRKRVEWAIRVLEERVRGKTGRSPPPP